MVVVEREEEVAFAAVEIAALGDLDVPVIAAAVLREAAAGAKAEAVVVAARDGIDDAGRGIGAVDGRGAVAQHLDARHGGGGELVHVGRERRDATFGHTDRVRREAAAVEKYEGVAGAKATESDRAVVAAGVGPKGVALVEGDRAADRKRVEQLGGGDGAPEIEVLQAQHGDRQRLLLVEPTDIGTRDREGLHGDRIGFLFGTTRRGGRRGRRRRGHLCTERAGQDCKQERARNEAESKAGGPGRCHFHRRVW